MHKFNLPSPPRFWEDLGGWWVEGWGLSWRHFFCCVGYPNPYTGAIMSKDLSSSSDTHTETTLGNNSNCSPNISGQWADNFRESTRKLPHHCDTYTSVAMLNSQGLINAKSFIFMWPNANVCVYTSNERQLDRKESLLLSNTMWSDTNLLKMVLISSNNNFWVIKCIPFYFTLFLSSLRSPLQFPPGVWLPYQKDSCFQRINNTSLVHWKIPH